MIRPSSCLRWLGVPALVLGLVAAGCGSNGSARKGGGSTGTTQAALAAATLNGSGSTFQLAFDQEVIGAFKQAQPGVTVNYGGGGSGKGKQDLADQVVDWAGTDSLVKAGTESNFKGGRFLYFPTVVAPITVSYNLAGVTRLQLAPTTIARIFSRQIKTWDDPAIKADNPGLSLPRTSVTVAHRSDGSGTTNNFTKFLVKAAPGVWTLGTGDTVAWPADTVGGNGNSGVASAIKSKDGAIGYVDFSDAKAAGLTFATVKNKAGKFLAPTLDGASAAVATATINPDLTFDPVFTDGDQAYPITSPTWILVYERQADRAKGEALKDFLRFVYGKGQQLAPSVDFAPLAPNLRGQALVQVDRIVVP